MNTTIEDEYKTVTHTARGVLGGKSRAVTFDVELFCGRFSEIKKMPTGWVYVDDDRSTGGVGHYTTQGKRERWVKKLADGTLAQLVYGSGYWPCAGGGSDWGNDGRLTEVDLPDTAVESALETIESI